ncbi:MAG: hypothetical protein NC430_03945 [bacterium]|nr:hypothetical protein [bacterium]
MEIWKDLLLKNKRGSEFVNARTILEVDKNKKFQVFEVLITETLAIIDPETEWHSLPVQGDDGVDFIGEIQQIKVPYIISHPSEVVLGQIKRRKGSYTKDDFHLDIIKIIEYYTNQCAKDSALFEIIHVLSTDSKVDLSKWMENITFPYTTYKILPVNALDFLRFWKINSKFISWELSGIYSEQQLQPLMDYIDSLQENWDDLIQVHIKVDSLARIDDEISVRITLLSTVDLSLSLIAEWIPPEENSHIVLLYPSNIIQNNICKYVINVYRELCVTMRLKSIASGKKNLGKINIYSLSGTLICSNELGEIDIQPGMVNKFFSLPCEKILIDIRESLKTNMIQKFKAFALLGQGGIGKTRIARELCLSAQNESYYTIAVQNANDFSNSRNLFFDLIIKLINFENQNIISYDNIYERLRVKLGANFSDEWNVSVLNYILGEDVSESDLENVAKCILTLLIIQLHKQSIFIWFSDMHWASKETITLLQKLLKLLRLNNDFLNNNLLLLFEGRDGDTLQLEDKIIFPYKWLEFCKETSVKSYKLGTWTDENSFEFAKMLVNPFNKPQSSNMKELIQLLMQYSSGNPMHIKELLRFLNEKDNIRISEDGTLMLINSNLVLDSTDFEISEVILKRIKFFQEKYPDIIDFYIMLSVITYNGKEMYDYVHKQLSKKYFNYELIEKDIGIVSEEHVEKIFLHEYYKELLKGQCLSNDFMVNDLVKYYEEHCAESIDGYIDIILLMLKKDDVEFSLIANKLRIILNNNCNDYQKLRCYQLLLELPSKYRSFIREEEIYFRMSDTTIRIASWKDSQRFLKKILTRKHSENDLEGELYQIIACKNLGNMYGVALELEKSLEICREGLDRALTYIERREFTNATLLAEFNRQYEMLLNRMAVSYWFAGQPETSAPYQEDALLRAQKREDTYAIAHTLYETGMRLLHQDIYLGTKNIKAAIEIFPEQSKFTEYQEKYLVKTELLIGQLLICTKNNDSDLLNSIQKESEELCKALHEINANYEHTLCNIVNGICNIMLDKYEIALNRFFTALNISNLGELNTLQWKSHLNIAETFLLIFEQTKDKYMKEQAIFYAKCGKKILREAREINRNLTSYQKLTETPYCYFNSIISGETFTAVEPEKTMIQIKYKNYYFYIMD